MLHEIWAFFSAYGWLVAFVIMVALMFLHWKLGRLEYRRGYRQGILIGETMGAAHGAKMARTNQTREANIIADRILTALQKEKAQNGR